MKNGAWFYYLILRQAARTELEQQLQTKEQEEEVRRRQLHNQLREVEMQLEDERRAKVSGDDFD